MSEGAIAAIVFGSITAVLILWALASWFFGEERRFQKQQEKWARKEI